MTEPTTTASAAAAGLIYKVGLTAGAGILGAAIMAAVDPPASRKELFLQGAAAGIGSLVFGPAALHIAADFYSRVDPAQVEWAVPVYFLVGALSWGIFGAVAQFRRLVAKNGAKKLAGVVSLDAEESK